MLYKHYHIQHIQNKKVWLEYGCGILEDVIARFEEDRQEYANGTGGKYSFSYIPHPEDLPSLIYRERIISCTKTDCEKHPDFYTSNGQ
jgi:hypothetical protein